MSERLSDFLCGLLGAQIAFLALRATGAVRWPWYITIAPLAIGELTVIVWLIIKIRKG